MKNREIECLNKCIGYITPLISLIDQIDEDLSKFMYDTNNHLNFMTALKTFNNYIYNANKTEKLHAHDTNIRTYFLLLKDEIKELLERHKDHLYNNPGISYYGQLELIHDNLDEYLSADPSPVVKSLQPSSEETDSAEFRNLKSVDMRAYIDRVFDKSTHDVLNEPPENNSSPDPIIQGMRMRENIERDPRPYTSYEELMLNAVKSLRKEIRSSYRYTDVLTEHEVLLSEGLERALDLFLEIEGGLRDAM